MLEEELEGWGESGPSYLHVVGPDNGAECMKLHH